MYAPETLITSNKLFQFDGAMGENLPTKDKLGREYPSDSPAGQKARIWNLAKSEIRNNLKAVGML